MCLGDWSVLNLVKDLDVTSVTVLSDVDGDGDNDMELEDGWDSIVL